MVIDLHLENENTMKNILKFILAFFLIFGLYNPVSAQMIELEEDSTNLCLQHGSNSRKAFGNVKLFLILPQRAELRQEVGAGHETVEAIEAVTDEQVCQALSQIIQQNEKYNSINLEIAQKPNKVLYMYKTENLYYLYWDYDESMDDMIVLGPHKLFIVVSKDYNQIWEYYL